MSPLKRLQLYVLIYDFEESKSMNDRAVQRRKTTPWLPIACEHRLPINLKDHKTNYIWYIMHT